MAGFPEEFENPKCFHRPTLYESKVGMYQKFCMGFSESPLNSENLSGTQLRICLFRFAKDLCNRSSASHREAHVSLRLFL